MVTILECCGRHQEFKTSGVKPSKARLISEAEARRKKPQELATKKKRSALEQTSEPETETAANDLKTDYEAEARDALNRVHQKWAAREVEQKSSSNSITRELKISSTPLKHLR